MVVGDHVKTYEGKSVRKIRHEVQIVTTVQMYHVRLLGF